MDTTDQLVISNKRNSESFFDFILILLILIANVYLLYLTILDSSFLWLTIGVFIFFTIPAFYRLLFGFNRIEANSSSLVFVNTKTNKNRVFSYEEITLFKSYMLTKSLGPMGGATAGESYNVFDIEFGDKFSTNISENDFDSFHELKLFINSKINN